VPGFELTETLAGRLRLAGDGKERSVSLTIRARSGPITAFLRRPALFLTGFIDAPGFASQRPLMGSLDATKLFAERRLDYAFTFAGDDGVMYVFTGEKSFVPRNFVVSFTLLAGAIHDTRGALVGDVLLRFDLRGDLVRFAKSLRITR
jgi:hypothetical protein